MKLKRVDLQGFKSFVDKTTLEFDEGITSILGPNGCGKSNIVDAIRWVLGEQSAKQLRGTRMEDIIFNGSARRKPVGLCEVALTFTNHDRKLPIEFDEVTVKRRVTRDGFSQYFLNNAPVRLKDLREIFFESGVNNTAYSVIEQEKIGRVLSDNADEVRQLIEEGAGIVRYKARRKEAQRKLKQTEQDLLRLHDITEEIGREVRSLSRQVGKARRYRRLYAETRALDLLLAERASSDMDARERELSDSLQELATLAEADSGELAELRARIEATRPAVDEREAERHGLEESLQAYEQELQQVEQKVLLLDHRTADHKQRLQENTEAVADICARREGYHEEINGLTNRRTETAAAATELASSLAGIEEELKLVETGYDADRSALENAAQLNMEFIETDNRHRAGLRELEIRRENRRERLTAMEREGEPQHQVRRAGEMRLAELATRKEELTSARRDQLGVLAATERGLQDVQDRRSTLRDEVALREARRESLRSRHELLQRIKDSYHGYSGAAREVLNTWVGDPGVLGTLADSLNVREGWTEALEILLGDMLDSVVVDDADKALDLVDAVRTAEKGRASFLLTGAQTGGRRAVSAPEGGRPIRELVDGPGADTRHLRGIFDAAWAFETDAAAVDAASRHDGSEVLICVSRGGLLVTSDGLVRGGRGKGEEVSLLGRGEKLDRLEQDIRDLDEQIVGLNRDRETEGRREEELKVEVATGRDELTRLGERLGKVHVDEAEVRSGIAAAAQRLAAIARDSEDVDASLRELAEREASMRGDLDESGRRRDSSHVRVEDLRLAVVDSEERRDAMRAEVAEKRVELSRRQGEERELGTALSHLQESVAEITAGEERLRQEIASTREELERMEQEAVQRREQINAGMDERNRRRLLVQASVEAIAQLHQETAVWHDRVKEIEDQRNSCREQGHAAETELATLDVRRNNLLERVEEQHKGRFRELIRSIDREALPKALEIDEGMFQPDQARDLLEDGRRKLNSLGAVNHLAIEEYEQKKERLGFLEGQLADVEKARTDLTATIDKINYTARRLFKETFEDVRRNYVAVFHTLFEGGRADLFMERTDDPLESNIRILAQPKGKRVEHIRLLSGGERCLTALSLLFAVYLVKPSPFCLLDEADAPLDDANIQRFVRMLREFSAETQFLVVTHNKLTMETANHLYGVTMMEEGVSSLVSVSFQDVADSQSDDELGQAIAAQRRHIDDTEEEKAVLAAADGGDATEMRFVLDNSARPERTDDTAEGTEDRDREVS